MEKKSFIDRHPNATSVISVLVWFAFIALLALCTSCKGTQNYVEIVKWDTLHVYHTDTIREIHNDTIREKVVITIHDSIIKQTIITNVVNEQGDVVHTEKETNNEVWHNADTSSSLIQHTVDSLLQAKMDSIYNASHKDKPVVVERQKSWWEKFTDAVRNHFAWIGFIILIGGIIWFAWKTK
ncbi:MAG: hypothetical protein PUC18_12700 [Prevotellaceae bacterium]|nr:hypothetical protein [Prevotellaceae bacterium]